MRTCGVSLKEVANAVQEANHTANDMDLRFGRNGLTPAFAWVTLDDDGFGRYSYRKIFRKAFGNIW